MNAFLKNMGRHFMAMCLLVLMSPPATAELQKNDSLTNAGLESLDNRFQQFSTRFYTKLIRFDNSPKIDSINSLAQTIDRYRLRNQPVSATAAIINNLELVEKNINATPVIHICGLLLETNEWNTASQLYKKIKKQGDKSLVSNVSLPVAKYYFSRNQWKETIDILESIRSDLPPEDYHHALLMHGIALQHLQKHQPALTLYVNIPSSSRYYAAARLNMALANIRQGRWTDAHIVINGILNDKKYNGDSVLTDRLYTVLGYSLLRQQSFQNSRAAFGNVSPDGSYTNKALLGLALAAAYQEDYAGALDIVKALRGKKNHDLPVDEANLLIPYFHEKLEQLTTASAGYAEAIKYYEIRAQSIKGAMPSDPDSLGKQVTAATSSTIILNDEVVDLSDKLPKFIFDNIRMLASFQPHVNRIGDVTLMREHEALNADYRNILQKAARMLLDEKASYIAHYMNQSRYGLARMQDQRLAYLEYLKHASKDEKSRVDALRRLAQLELQLSGARNREPPSHAAADAKDEIYYASTDRTIEMLQILLRDHPDAENSDKTLYQLARAYDQKGFLDKSLEAMTRLVNRYPTSPYYVESQFRLAEHAFIKNNYGKAEDIYTDILASRNNSLFREKARYKRGWARFKQNYYRAAADDFVAVIDMNDFAHLAKATEVVKNNLEEYFRALGLAFVYMGGPTALSDYFRENRKFKHVYQTYIRVSDLYLAEQRYSDAVNTLNQFNKDHPQSIHLPESALKSIDIWLASGFIGNFARALENFYAAYHPRSNYWSKPGIRREVRTTVTTSLKNFIVRAGSHFHEEYQSTGDAAAFTKAKTWYERYLKDYQAYSRKDNIHFLYAELLSRHASYANALTHYELAAYDDDIIVNKEAAYATVLMAAKLHRAPGDPALQKTYLEKLARYSRLYVQLYPDDARSTAIMTRAAEETYREGMYRQAIDLLELHSNIPYTEATYNIHGIKAHSYFKLGRYRDAETAYQGILQHYKLDPKIRTQINGNLAISIYNQATAAKEKNDMAEALRHYARISDAVPASDIAATGLYEAIMLAFDDKSWVDTVKFIQRFQKLYPSHKLSHDVSRKLSIAYLNTNQDVAAASELIKASRSDENIDYKIAALWKAAGLYESKKDYPAAIKAFEEYVATYPRPYPQYMEALQKLTELHEYLQDESRADLWRTQMLDADKKTPGDLKTDRTNYVSSMAALQLARRENKKYSSMRLTLPLNRSLGYKKNALQKALNFYGRAASYGIPEAATEATYAIADIYYSFSKALLDSERPKNLSAAELEQYRILLEDQAFPFEDNAIKFHEKNISYIQQGIFNDWAKKSLVQLKQLFPARYNREPMLEPRIDVLH